MNIFITCGIILILIAIIKFYKIHQERKEEDKYRLNQMTSEEKEIYEQKMIDKEYKIKQKAELKLKREKANTIVKTKIVGGSTDSRKKVSSSITRGVVGGALLGPVGMVGGALSGKNKVTTKTTFLVEYADGHRNTVTVNNNTIYFNELCKYLDM